MYTYLAEEWAKTTLSRFILRPPLPPTLQISWDCLWNNSFYASYNATQGTT